MRIDLAVGDDPAALVRAAEAGSVVVVIAPGRDPLSLATARAAIEPLAIEQAPGARVNAVQPSADAHPERVEAAVAFLEGARSTTGQILEIS